MCNYWYDKPFYEIFNTGRSLRQWHATKHFLSYLIQDREKKEACEGMTVYMCQSLNDNTN